MHPSTQPMPEPDNLPGRHPLPPTPFDDIASELPDGERPPPAVLHDPPPGAPPKPGAITVPTVFQPHRLHQFPDPPYRNEAPPATIANLEYLLREYGIVVRYNTVKKKTEILLPHSAVVTTDNADNVALTHIMSAAALHGLQLGQIPAYVEVVADRNPYNPVAQWIKSRPWDGQDRLAALQATIETREDFPAQLKNVLLHRWLLSGVAAALMPRGFKARGVLTFQGPQGIGKTSWIRNLVTDPVLREAAIKVDHHLDASNKDTILGAITHWIVEIGELDSSFRKDVARLKGFLTSDQDKLRRPYARGESEYARRTVFAATVNESNFLVDMTGNSRWWTLPVQRIVYDHGIDMQQVFAQLAVEFQRGEQWWLTGQEERLLDEANRDHLSISVIREGLLEKLDLEPKDDASCKRMTAKQVLTDVLDYKEPTNQQCKECAAILRELLGDSARINGLQKWRISLDKPQPNGGDFVRVD